MATVTIHEAKTHLSKLLVRMEGGEEIIIMRGKEPVARLEPLRKKADRTLGRLKHVAPVPDSFFFDPLPDDELALWNGEGRGAVEL